MGNITINENLKKEIEKIILEGFVDHACYNEWILIKSNKAFL